MDQLTLLFVILILTILGSAIIVSEALSRLTREVSESNSIATSAVALIAGLAQQIRDAIGDDDELEALADSLDASQSELAAAIAANTPGETGGGSDPQPAPEPQPLPPETTLQETDGVGAPETIEEANAAAGDGAGDESNQG